MEDVLNIDIENNNIVPEKLYIPNSTTMAAIEEGKKIASDKKVKGYKKVKDLSKALDV